MNFDDIIKMRDEAKKTIFELITMSKDIEWDIEAIVPDTIYQKNALAKIYCSFKKQTNIPTALPVFSFFGFLSAYLLKNEVKINVPKAGKIYPDIWIINLADSGSSKTFSKSIIEESIPTSLHGEKLVEANIEQCSSSAAFISEISDKNFGFYFQDECAQVLKQMENSGSPLAEMKKYLLMTYDHSQISRKTKKDMIKIDNPALTILWLNTIDSFVKNISPESIYDGFCQRFMYVMSVKDIDRQLQDFPLYDKNTIKNEIKEEMEKLFTSQIDQEYTVSSDAVKYYEEGFKQIYLTHFNGQINESFYRRVMFNSFKYSLFYHLILKKEGSVIDEESMSYALKVCMIHLHSIKKLLTYKDSGYSQEIESIKQMVAKARAIKKDCEKSGVVFNARTLQRKVKAIKTAEQANLIIERIAKEN